MNELLPSRYAESVHRLAVGIEPLDAIRGARAGAAARVTVAQPAAARAMQVTAHAGGRWSIRYGRGLPDHVDVRIDDPTRRFVARHLRFPVVALAEVLGDTPVGAERRTWRPALFPGAAYALSPSATAIRGLARTATGVARWARVEATLFDDTAVLWRAHADDRGEFLLAIGPDPSAGAELADRVKVTVTVRAAKPAPAPSAAGTADPYWDLPLETVAPPGPDDVVSTGQALPANYINGFFASRDVDLVPGRVHADLDPFELA